MTTRAEIHELITQTKDMLERAGTVGHLEAAHGCLLHASATALSALAAAITYEADAARRRGATPGLACAVCLFTVSGAAAYAITVINGEAVCEDHTGYVGGGLHSRAIGLAIEAHGRRD